MTLMNAGGAPTRATLTVLHVQARMKRASAATQWTAPSGWHPLAGALWLAPTHDRCFVESRGCIFIRIHAFVLLNWHIVSKSGLKTGLSSPLGKNIGFTISG